MHYVEYDLHFDKSNELTVPYQVSKVVVGLISIFYPFSRQPGEKESSLHAEALRYVGETIPSPFRNEDGLESLIKSVQVQLIQLNKPSFEAGVVVV